MKKLNLALITGGKSSERDISLVSADGVKKHLDPLKYDVTTIDSANASELALLIKNKPDVALIIQHGKGDEDGAIQGFLQTLNIPFTGSGILASALAMDKSRCKDFLATRGIPVAKSATITRSDIGQAPHCPIPVPYVVKPNAGGSSDGVTIIRDEGDVYFRDALVLAFGLDDVVLIEEYIQGTEISVPVLGNARAMALPVIEIRPKHLFFDRECKYTPGMTEDLCPAPIGESLTRSAQQIAVIAHTALGCMGMSRSDMIIRNTPEPTRDDIYLIEVNTIPGMTPTSLLPLSALTAGYSYESLLDTIIGYALEGVIK